MGLASFSSELITYNQHTFLAIERYDRQVSGHEITALHQEDAAQALGLDWISSVTKFQDPSAPPRQRGRPSALRIAELFGSIGDHDVENWLRYLLFTVLIGNHDAHAKNVSVLHDRTGTRIADLYDAVPILHINDAESRVGERRIRDEWSLAIGGEFSHHSVTLDHFHDEADSWGGVFSNLRVEQIIHSTLEAFASALQSTPGSTRRVTEPQGSARVQRRPDRRRQTDRKAEVPDPRPKVARDSSPVSEDPGVTDGIIPADARNTRAP